MPDLSHWQTVNAASCVGVVLHRLWVQNMNIAICHTRCVERSNSNMPHRFAPVSGLPYASSACHGHSMHPSATSPAALRWMPSPPYLPQPGYACRLVRRTPSCTLHPAADSEAEGCESRRGVSGIRRRGHTYVCGGLLDECTVLRYIYGIRRLLPLIAECSFACVLICLLVCLRAVLLSRIAWFFSYTHL